MWRPFASAGPHPPPPPAAPGCVYVAPVSSLALSAVPRTPAARRARPALEGPGRRRPAAREELPLRRREGRAGPLRPPVCILTREPQSAAGGGNGQGSSVPSSRNRRLATLKVRNFTSPAGRDSTPAPPSPAPPLYPPRHHPGSSRGWIARQDQDLGSCSPQKHVSELG